MSERFDLIVIGGGPGGYIAAIRAAQLGLSVVCIDDWADGEGKPAPGGVCTNVGCIPSKALLQSSEHYEQAACAFDAHGIEVQGLTLHLDRMQARKQRVVKQNNDGILFLFRKHGIAFIHGRGIFGGRDGDAYRIRIDSNHEQTVYGRRVIVATGSRPRELSGAPFDENLILSSSGALGLTQVPQHLGVIGAGAIGLEIGSVWRRLGARVTVLEAMSAFLGAVDRQIADEAHKQLTRQGLIIHLGARIATVSTADGRVAVEYEDARGETRSETFDRLLVSIGRVPNTAGLGAETVGLKLDERGFVAVDADCRTNLPDVWAIGDAVRGPMLAHKAEEEGVAVAERIVGQHGHVNYDTIPWVIYTSPEIAWVGKNEQELSQQGIAFRAGVFPFLANGRARAAGETAGMVKILADARTDEILGVHIIGPQASELIGEMGVAMAFRASSEDIARVCHAHPTLSETLREAALAVDKRALNY
jgi:dihydrolipoamide dehydrogenase